MVVPMISMSAVRNVFWQVVTPRMRRSLDAQEVRLQRVHPGDREQRRGVVLGGDQRRGRQAPVVALHEEVEEGLADLVGCHRDTECRQGRATGTLA